MDVSLAKVNFLERAVISETNVCKIYKFIDRNIKKTVV